MKFERVQLKNYKCYEETDVRLDRGVTVIHGLNGSGKSSLLEACFFALYGASALDRTLDEVVTKGADEMEVDLWFTHDGGDYHLHRRIRATGDRPTTTDCTLETPSGSIDGVTDVESHVASLLRMDEDAFVNCAYVRQGEVNKLINASPRERQDMIDDLLQLGKLEEYRERAGDARLGVEDVLQDVSGGLKQLNRQIEELEAKDLHERRAALQTNLSEVEEKIENYEQNREQARQTKQEAEATLEEYEEKRDELSNLRERIDDLREKISETESEREDVREQARNHRERAAELDERVDDLLAETALDEADETVVEAKHEELADELEARQSDRQDVVGAIERLTSEANSHEERANDLETRASEKRSEAADLETEAEELAADLEEQREQVRELAADIEAKEDEFESADVAFGEAESLLADPEEDLDDCRETETELREQLATARSRVEEGEDLLDQGKCPECGQDVEGSPHVDSLDEYRAEVAELEERLADVEEEKATLRERVERAEHLVSVEADVRDLRSQKERVESLLDEREGQVEEKRERASTLREEAAELEADAEDARETADAKREAADEKRSELGELNAQTTELKSRLETLDDLSDAVDERDDHEREAERLAEKAADLADRNEERREHLTDARERKRSLDESFDEESVETAKQDKRRAEDYLEQVESKLSDLDERRDDLLGDIKTVEANLEQLEALREERDEVEARVERLRALREETADLESLYGDLRAELRQQNVSRLERLLNETFDLVYQNDSYARIELDGQYELTVYQKDGETLDPEQLSGGERAIFNLSLRCAIYRLLAEGIEGAAPLPPLILDEPTVFLDSGHVSQLVDLVESMRELGVEQIVVVSHDDELVGAADDLLHVEKDSTTNRSHVERGVRERVLETAGD
ncbi:DNA double-strand break repair ATPase Rad50 [Halospeciosus flavus]|uniref:DNA double-strand break repair Rad50 ATPase n=1 Tax=Halospeciosus flavus TaxID=3032283 RepID=A0ABD5Z4K6_9EURY|nr:DNA double-strand break repair ATPase Rad50 [Halospeciosus flavus]